MNVLFTLFFKFFICVKSGGVFFEIINHRVSYGVGKSGFFAIKNVVGKVVSLKCVAKQIFSFSVFIEFELRIYRHHIMNEIKIAERYACFERVYRNATVCTENVVHMKLSDPLFGFLLKFFSRRGKIGIFVAEKLIRYFSRKKHADICVFMYPFAKQIHSHACADSGYVKCSEQGDNAFK